MATIRSFRLNRFYQEHASVKIGEYVILVSYSPDNPSLAFSKNPLNDLKTVFKDFKLVYVSPKHFNNTHDTEGLQTIILEKVA